MVPITLSRQLEGVVSDYDQTDLCEVTTELLPAVKLDWLECLVARLKQGMPWQAKTPDACWFKANLSEATSFKADFAVRPMSEEVRGTQGLRSRS
jgi:hypothetical protein